MQHRYCVTVPSDPTHPWQCVCFCITGWQLDEGTECRAHFYPSPSVYVTLILHPYVDPYPAAVREKSVHGLVRVTGLCQTVYVAHVYTCTLPHANAVTIQEVTAPVAHYDSHFVPESRS